ncbi:MAG TPA: SAM-dependent methyltransferase [Actinomycetota bacterium]|nr:SAM-dependent methyltransferase [Actinomycetota bacterium]
MEEPLRSIRRAIARRGPITFAEYMELALYGEGGFYRTGTPVGADGHFVTSPHVHPVFARLLGRAHRELWEGLGRPDPFPSVEVGAGDGTLARGLRDALADLPMEAAAVERSPAARRALREVPLRVAERLGDLGPIEGGVALANELLDNLPFRVVRGRDGGPVEVLVDAGPEGLREVEVPCRPDLAAEAPPLRPGEEAAVPVGAFGFLDELAATLTRGYALLIDYGSPRPPAGPVHGYRHHRVVERVLQDPGTADLTAGVDLAAVARRARAAGLAVLGIVDQRSALLALGLDAWIREELDRQADLLAAGRGTEAVRAWGGRSRATLLADPAALGRLRWLLLATPGLPAPPWLRRATALRVRRGAEPEVP